MDAGDSEPKSITLLIKTASQEREDQTIEGVRLNWTVKDLKTHLSSVYRTRPAPSDQRLIYAGKLLSDHQNIGDLLGQTDSIPTLHLVFALRNPLLSPLGARPKVRQTEQQQPAGPPAAARPSSSSAGALRQRGQMSSSPAAAPQTLSSPPRTDWSSASVPAAPPMAPPAFPTYSLYSAQQLQWLQRVYAWQYYMQYHAALAAAAASTVSPAASSVGPSPPVPAPQLPVPAPLANQNPVRNGPFLDPGAANQNMPMNAQGGAVVEDVEDVERDWLDRLYSAARFGVMLMIVYFNSSLSRFLLVMSSLLLMCLHAAGWFPFRRHVQVQRPDPQQPQQPPAVQHNQDNENRNPDAAEELSDAQRDERGAQTAVLVPPHRVSVMWTAWLFFKTFLSSLIPEAPERAVN